MQHSSDIVMSVSFRSCFEKRSNLICIAQRRLQLTDLSHNIVFCSSEQRPLTSEVFFNLKLEIKMMVPSKMLNYSLCLVKLPCIGSQHKSST